MEGQHRGSPRDCWKMAKNRSKWRDDVVGWVARDNMLGRQWYIGIWESHVGVSLIDQKVTKGNLCCSSELLFRVKINIKNECERLRLLNTRCFPSSANMLICFCCDHFLTWSNHYNPLPVLTMYSYCKYLFFPVQIILRSLPSPSESPISS